MTTENKVLSPQGKYYDQVLIQSVNVNGHPQTPIEKFFATNSGEVLPAYQPPPVPQKAPEVVSESREEKSIFPTSQQSHYATPRETVTDLAAEYEWLREERKRLENYTLSQFSLITKQREELAGRRAEVETTFAFREQELNRQMKLLAERGEALKYQEQTLARKESELILQEEKLKGAEERVHNLEQTATKLQRSIEQHRLALEHLRLQTTQSQEAARAAEVELIAFEKGLQSRKKEFEAEKARFEMQRQQLERRCGQVEQAEASIRRREGEFEELEFQLRSEIEQQEKKLAADAQELERIRQALRLQAANGQSDFSHSNKNPELR